MAQATNPSTTSASCFHNHADPALADAIGQADAVLKGAAVINGSTAMPVERPMFPPTRRAFIHAIAALPIAATSPAAAAQTLDADLIELGAQFEPLVDQYYVAKKRWARSMATAHADYDSTAADRHDQYSPEALEDSCERSGVNEALDTLSAIRPEMEELAKAINAASVRSIAGLRAKAMVALWKLAPLRADDTEFSFENDYRFQQIFTAVAELCGLKDKMVATGYQLPDSTTFDEDFHWSEPAGQV